MNTKLVKWSSFNWDVIFILFYFLFFSHFYSTLTSSNVNEVCSKCVDKNEIVVLTHELVAHDAFDDSMLFFIIIHIRYYLMYYCPSHIWCENSTHGKAVSYYSLYTSSSGLIKLNYQPNFNQTKAKCHLLIFMPQQFSFSL